MPLHVLHISFICWCGCVGTYINMTKPFVSELYLIVSFLGGCNLITLLALHEAYFRWKVLLIQNTFFFCEIKTMLIIFWYYSPYHVILQIKLISFCIYIAWFLWISITVNRYIRIVCTLFYLTMVFPVMFSFRVYGILWLTLI